MRTLMLMTVLMVISALTHAQPSVTFKYDVETRTIEHALASDGAALGYINWDESIVVAYGKGLGASYARTESQRRVGAKRAAFDNAYANMQQILQAAQRRNADIEVPEIEVGLIEGQLLEMSETDEGAISVSIVMPIKAIWAKQAH